MEWATQLRIIGDVALAILLGGVIGFERELADKPAGLRTHMLIAGSAALLTGVGDAMIGYFQINPESGTLRSDPLRIIEAIITGVSFIGAGTIIRRSSGEQVEGLTTAASLIFSAAVGICAALHLFTLAAGSTVAALVILRVFGWAEKYAERKRAQSIEADDSEDDQTH